MRYLAALLLLVVICPSAVRAQELVPDTVTIMKAKVLQVLSRERKEIPGIGVQSDYQTIQVIVLDGPEKGETLTVENDFLSLEAGEVFYLRHAKNELDATDYYSVLEPYRLPQLAILFALFVGLVLFFGGKQGARGLLALFGSLFFILFLLLPGILKGYPPILVAVGVSAVIVTLGSYVTHGFNKTTSTAVLGMIATVSLTGTLAYWAIPFTNLSGFTAEESTYLNINTRGMLDLAGLLIGGILIGTLGVLYDAAIGQAVAVEELARAGKHLTRWEVYQRAVRIGREHIGALVNTLAIAYVGAALPLLLLFYGFTETDLFRAMNREIFATEIVRAIIGSIGLVLAVPITTYISVRLLVRDETKEMHLDRSR